MEEKSELPQNSNKSVKAHIMDRAKDTLPQKPSFYQVQPPDVNRSYFGELDLDLLGSFHSGRGTVKTTARTDIGQMIIKELAILNGSFSSIKSTDLLKAFFKVAKPSFFLSLSLSGNNLLNSFGFFITSLQSTDSETISAFGLTIFFTCVTIYTLTQPIIEKVGVGCSLAYSVKDMNGVKINLYRGLLTFMVYIAFLFCPIVLFSQSILEFIGIPPSLSSLSSSLQHKLFFIDLLRLFNEFLVAFLSSQGIEAAIGRVTGPLVAGCICICYFLGVGLNWGVTGWVVGRAVFDFCNLGVLVTICWRSLDRRVFGKVVWADVLDLKGMASFFGDVLMFTGSLYSEVIGWEMAAYMTTLTHNVDQIAAHTSLVNICYFVYNLGLGFSSSVRTRVNYLLGNGQGQSAKNFFFICLAGMSFVCMLLGTLIFNLREKIVLFYASDNEKVAFYLRKLLILYAFLVPGDFLTSFMFTVARSTNQTVYNIGLNVVLIIFLHCTASYYVVVHLGGSCVETVSLLYFSAIGTFVCLIWRFHSLDWNAISPMKFQTLQVEFKSIITEVFKNTQKENHSDLMEQRKEPVELEILDSKEDTKSVQTI